MSKNENIFNQISTILTNALVPLGSLNYVKEVIKYGSESLPIFPVIIIMPVNEREENYTTPEMKRIFQQYSISCWIEVIKKEDTVTGSSVDSSKGVLDMVTNVKNELEKFPDLNGNALKIKFISTNYLFENYPFAVGEIIIETEVVSLATNR